MRFGLLLPAALLVAGLAAGCGDGDAPEKKLKNLTVFHAGGLTPVLEAVRKPCEKELGIKLRTEASGSQVACRKIAELGRKCDLVMLADAGLVASLLKGNCSWRLDFASDEVVLAVGQRAPRVAEAEKDWTKVLTAGKVKLGRVDENQGPIGYRTLMVWKLQEKLGAKNLHDRLRAKGGKVVDHVARLTPLLKSAEIDYAFVYRSICIAHDVRYIRLEKRVNLGSADHDYSAAKVTYGKARKKITVKGAPIIWTLSIPDRSADEESARRFVRWLLSDKKKLLEKHGFRPLARPRFHGPKKAFGALKDFAGNSGKLK